MKWFRVLRFENKPTLESAVRTAHKLGLRYWFSYEQKRFWILLLCTNLNLWKLGRNMK
jgi:hypothetical protein